MPNPCHFLQSWEIRVSQDRKTLFFYYRTSTLQLHSEAAITRQRDKDIRCHYAPPAPESPCLIARPAMHIKGCRAQGLTKPEKGEQQQLVVIRDFLLKHTVKALQTMPSQIPGQQLLSERRQEVRRHCRMGYSGNMAPREALLIPEVLHLELFRPATSSGSAQNPC